MKFRYFLWLGLALVAACSRPEYDISDGVNTEVTLFQDELSVPIGGLGPFTFGSVFELLDEVEGIGPLISEFFKVAPDGSVYVEEKGNIFKISAYELENRLDDPAVPQSWNAGYCSTFIGGASGILYFLGFGFVDQHLEITMENPFTRAIPVTSGAATYVLAEEGGEKEVPAEGLGQFTIPAYADTEMLVQPDFSGYPKARLTGIKMEDLTLDLPAHPASCLRNELGNLFLSLDYHYVSRVTLSGNFEIPFENYPIGGIDIPIGRYKLKKCELSMEFESTFPMQIEVKDLKVLLPETEWADPDEPLIDENVKIVTGFTIEGGSEEKPAVSAVTLSIEALEGTIPDIPGLLLNLNVKAQPGLEAVPLSTWQGIRVKSSSARLTGGITIPKE